MYTEIHTGKCPGFALKLMRMISRWGLLREKWERI